MSESETSAPSSSQDSMPPAPWWVRLCRWLWKIIAFVGVSVVLSLVVSVLSTWLISSSFPPRNSPVALLIEWLVARWPVTLIIGCCSLLLAALIGAVSRWSPQHTASLLPTQQNRMHMLRRLRRSYDEVLDQSLQGAAWIELGLAYQPDAVQNAATLLLRLPHRAEQSLPPGTSITLAYEQAAHELLILGEPGAGKSTLLLTLAQQLVTQAERDEALPLPVLVPLSPWTANSPPFQYWLAEQVAQLYDIPEQLAQRWVQEGRFLPLLDGLDEMKEKVQPACIGAINDYHHAYPGPLVVCSRKAEFEEASKLQPIILESALVVQPLSHEQVDAYLAQAGEPLKALRRELNKNPGLRELANTPLMLSVLMLSYKGIPLRSLPQKEPELQQQVWTDYVERMVERKGDAVRYPLERTRAWLHWLAQQMREHNPSIFYLEHLQLDWLPSEQELVYIWLAVRIPGILIGVLAGLTIALFLGSQDPTYLLQDGVLGGFLGGLFNEGAPEGTVLQRVQNHPRPTTHHIIPKRAIISALIGLACGLSLRLNPNYSLGDWLRDGSISGFGIGLGCWLLLSLLPRFSSGAAQTTTTDTAQHQLDLRYTMQAPHKQRALLVAAVFGGERGLIGGLGIGLTGGLGIGLINALLFGLMGMVVSLIFEVQTGYVDLTERLEWTWGSLIQSLFTPRHFRIALVFASIVLVLFGLGFGLSSGLAVGLSFGLSSGLSSGLSYWLLVGLLQGISYEKVDDQDRRVLNQGIRRSFYNGGIMGIISGGVIGITGTLSFALINWLSFGLSNLLGNWLHSGPIYWVQEDLSLGWLLAVSSGLLICATNGGLAVLRHAILRLLLWHTHTFPLQVAPFFEDAKTRILLQRKGGGYSFIHNLLLNYFADTNIKTITPRHSTAS
jgi:MFS family permease